LGKTYSIKCAAVGNIINNHLRTWWEHKEPYGIYLGTPNSKKNLLPPSPFGRKKMGPRGCKLPPLIGWEGFSISNSVDHHLWAKLLAGALV
jgi:hypothetical protein